MNQRYHRSPLELLEERTLLSAAPLPLEEFRDCDSDQVFQAEVIPQAEPLVEFFVQEGAQAEILPLESVFQESRPEDLGANCEDILFSTEVLSSTDVLSSMEVLSAASEYHIQWGTYQIDAISSELLLDDWEMGEGTQKTYNINTLEINQEYQASSGHFLQDYASISDDWTVDTASVDTLFLKTGESVNVLDIMPVNASFLCVCDSAGEIVKAYEYLRGEELVADEIFARQIAYDTTFDVGDRIWYYGMVDGKVEKILTGYFVEKDFETGNGFNAYGLVSSYDTVRPVLACRGTEMNLEKIFEDANPNGVGYKLFQSAYSQVSSWLNEKNQDHWTTALVGHSLGGALSQWLAAEYVTSGKIYSVTTFNATGISEQYAEKFNANKTNCGQVTHNIVNGDLVSMAGRAFIDGTNLLYSYERANVLQKHSIPISVSCVCDEKGIAYTKPEDLSSETISTDTLNSYWFHYSDPWYLGYVAAASILNFNGAKLFFRGSTEDLRQTVGGFLHEFLKISDTSARTLTIKSLPFKGWELQNTEIVWNPKIKSLNAVTTLHTHHGFTIKANMALVEWSLNTITVDLSNARIPVGFTGMIVTDAALTLNHIHDDQALELNGPINIQSIVSISGEIPDWFGGGTYSGTLARYSGLLDVSTERFQISGDFKAPYASAQGSETYLVSANGLFLFDWTRNAIQYKGNLDLLTRQTSGFITLAWGDVPKLEVGGVNAFTFPDDWWIVGGKTLSSASTALYFSGDSDPTNDYFFVGGTLAGVGMGCRYTFNPKQSFWANLDLIGAKEISREQAKIRQKSRLELILNSGPDFVLEPASLMLELSWDSSYESASIFLDCGGGQRVSESSFALYGITVSEDLVGTSSVRRFLVDLDSFDFDSWTFSVESKGTIISDAINEKWYDPLKPLEISISSVEREADGTLKIAVDSGDASADTVLSFYSDLESDSGELSDFQSLPLFQTTVGALENGSIRWKPVNLSSGAYRLSMRADDGKNYSIQTSFGSEIQIECTPHLVMTDYKGVRVDELVSWNATTVENLSLDLMEKEFLIVNEGNADAVFTDWTLEGDWANAFKFTAFTQDGASVGLQDMKLGAGETLRLRVGLDRERMSVGEATFSLSVLTNDEMAGTLRLDGSIFVAQKVGTVQLEERTVGVHVTAQEYGSYQVVLDFAPQTEVKVCLSMPDGVTANTEVLTFTPENWNTPQNVTLHLNEGAVDSASLIIHHLIATNDSDFQTGGISDVVVLSTPSSDYALTGRFVNTDGLEVATLTDWNEFAFEIRAKNNLSLLKGETADVILTLDPDFFDVDENQIVGLPDWVSCEFGERTALENGLLRVTAHFTALEDREVTENMVWGSVRFVPTCGKGLRGQDSTSLNVTANTKISGATVMAMPCDMNNDGSISIKDLVRFAKVFGQSAATAAETITAQVTQADFDGNGIVDILDLVLLARNFGKVRGVDLQPNLNQFMVLSQSKSTDSGIGDSTGTDESRGSDDLETTGAAMDLAAETLQNTMDVFTREHSNVAASVHEATYSLKHNSESIQTNASGARALSDAEQLDLLMGDNWDVYAGFRELEDESDALLTALLADLKTA